MRKKQTLIVFSVVLLLMAFTLSACETMENLFDNNKEEPQNPSNSDQQPNTSGDQNNSNNNSPNNDTNNQDGRLENKQQQN